MKVFAKRKGEFFLEKVLSKFFALIDNEIRGEKRRRIGRERDKRKAYPLSHYLHVFRRARRTSTLPAFTLFIASHRAPPREIPPRHLFVRALKTACRIITTPFLFHPLRTSLWRTADTAPLSRPHSPLLLLRPWDHTGRDPRGACHRFSRSGLRDDSQMPIFISGTTKVVM